MKQSYIASIHLENFRNHINFKAIFPAKTIILTGANGVGKTNLLEALSLLTPGRGLRRARFEDMLFACSEKTTEMSPKHWTIHVEMCQKIKNKTDGTNEKKTKEKQEKYVTETRKIGMSFTQNATQKRVIRIDGQTVPGMELKKLAPVLWLTPALDSLFTGSASERRRFFDRLVLAWIADHGLCVSAYEKAMRQRMAALEQCAAKSWIDGLEQQMARYACAITQNRLIVLARLQKEIDKQKNNAFPQANCLLEGDIEQKANRETHNILNVNTQEKQQIKYTEITENRGQKDENPWQDFLVKQWRQYREKDQHAKRTLKGPHRTDFQVIHRKKKLSAKFCSTGEQKALLTGLFLAQAQALSTQKNIAPILLLDEAIAHLDQKRRAALAEALRSLPGQAWLSGAEENGFQDFIHDGEIYKIQEE